jgi:dermatan 4-sulfotransferase 1
MANQQKIFNRTVAKYCPYVPSMAFDYAVNISLRYQYLYVETPKVGCSTIKATLQRLELDDKSFHRSDFEDWHIRAFSPLLKPSQVGDFDRFMVRKEIFKFCFVRNPYTRLLSAWLDKIEGKKPQKAQILLQLGHDPNLLDRVVTFEEFVRMVVTQPISMMDPHWRIQYYQTFQKLIRFDFIGRFESMSSDLHCALGRIAGNYELSLVEEVRHATFAESKLADFYTLELRDLVFDKYQIDFDTFGYKRNLP